MNQVELDNIRQQVRTWYKGKALQGNASSCCSPKANDCCDSGLTADEASSRLGYSQDEIHVVPDGSNLGLGCGNPQAIASLQQGEVVLDLGSGGGFDCFLASRQVGGNGRVIGVDMTPEMISRARGNALKGGYTNTEFRLGEIEHLPVQDNTVDVIISNCVINLSPDKQQVFHEAFRVLKSNGRLAISDVVAIAELPDEIKQHADSFANCISGASSIDSLYTMLEASGFHDIKIEPKYKSQEFINDWLPGSKADDYVVSAVITAIKP